MANPKPPRPAPPAPRTVNRAQLCVELGRSRQWVDARITDDPDFPVLQRGSRGVSYAFDLDQVRTYLQAEDRAASVFSAITPMARLANARAMMAEQDLADRMGKLIDAEEARPVLARVAADLRAIFGRAIGELTRRHGFSPACEQDFRASMDALADTFEADVGAALSPGGRHPPEEHPDPH